MNDHHDFAPGEWPFEDPINTGVFATVQVMNGDPVLFVSHDEEDGAWQFLHSPDLTDNDAGDLKYVCLGCVFEGDRSLAEVATLPLGWEATRAKHGSLWKRAASPAQNE